MSQQRLELLIKRAVLFLLTAYILLVKYICIEIDDKCVLDGLIDQHVSASAVSIVNKLDNMVNNCSL